MTGDDAPLFVPLAAVQRGVALDQIKEHVRVAPVGARTEADSW